MTSFAAQLCFHALATATLPGKLSLGFAYFILNLLLVNFFIIMAWSKAIIASVTMPVSTSRPVTTSTSTLLLARTLGLKTIAATLLVAALSLAKGASVLTATTLL